MAVLDPLRVVIENFPEDQVDELEAVNNPEDESAGTRTVPFSRVLYIERQDFLEDPPKKFFRLSHFLCSTHHLALGQVALGEGDSWREGEKAEGQGEYASRAIG